MNMSKEDFKESKTISWALLLVIMAEFDVNG